MMTRTLMAGLLMTGLLAAQAMDADARERQRSGSVTTADGRSLAANKSVSRQAGDSNINSSVQGSGGRGFNRSATGNYDETSQTYSRTGNITANDGRSATSSINAGRTDNGAYSNRNLTGPNGGSVATSTSSACTDGVSCTRNAERTVTGPEGQQVTRSGSATVTRSSGQ